MQEGKRSEEQYREMCSSGWNKALEGFLESQSFRRLVPGRGGHQMQYINPDAFMPRSDHEAVLRARGDADWQPITRSKFVDGIVAAGKGTWCPAPRRIVLIGASGMGKSKSMTWLEKTLNDRGLWAIAVTRTQLNEQSQQNTRSPALAAVIQKVARCMPDPREDEITAALIAAVNDDRLVILFDGLDQVPTTAETFSFLPGSEEWFHRCGFVLAGRPHAFQSWIDDATPARIDARDWRFVEPVAFTDEEGMRFANFDGHQRYHLAKRQLGELATVPRVLEFARKLSPDDLGSVYTLSDMFDEVVQGVLSRSIASASNAPVTTEINLRRFSRLLCALAFVAWQRWLNRRNRINDIGCLRLDGDVVEDVRRRMHMDLEPDMMKTLLSLADMSLIVSGNSTDLEWSSRTMVEFLAARWLSCYAGDYDRANPGHDARFMPIFYPEDLDQPAQELNQFVADFPAKELTPSSWLACARVWYDPQDNDANRRWPTEMMYRSWRTIHDIARRPVHDWWNVPYNDLSCSEVRVLDDAPVWRVASVSEDATREARGILDRFFGDFQRILDHGTDSQRAAARDMIGIESWCVVPAGTFEMGSRPEDQGFPRKLLPFWQRELDKVQTCRVNDDPTQKTSSTPPTCRPARCDEDVPRLAAEWLTKEEWFTGLQGRTLRNDDINWLTGVLRGIETRDEPDREAPDYRAAFEQIERKWRKRDEQPFENPQAVAGFSLHRFPVLNRWFGLFSPRHRIIVGCDPEQDVSRPAEGEPEPLSRQYLPDDAPRPADDHPVLYVSWFDAWAFCQWATWRDPLIPGRIYKVRLPHEPEWEYAVRWRRDEQGNLVRPTTRDRYWWGNDFYLTEDVPEDLTPRPEYARMAHVDGRPGRTGAPAALVANGLGLHDMLGNVWEWMANIYDTRSEERMVSDETGAAPSTQPVTRVGYSRFVPKHGQAPLINALRTMRGGLWYYLNLLATCTSRYRLTSDDRCYKMGFRLVREEWQLVREASLQSSGGHVVSGTPQRQRSDFADALIVTALPEEWEAVLEVNVGATSESSWREPPGWSGPMLRYRDFTTRDGELRIAVVQPYIMGRTDTALTAAALLERHPEIRCLAMCGVCAGRRGDVALGDVIIADRAWPYDHGKMKVTIEADGSRTEEFEGDMRLWEIMPEEWGQRAQRFRIDPRSPWIAARPRGYEEQGDWILARLVKNESLDVPERKILCRDWGKVLDVLRMAKRLADDAPLAPTKEGRQRICARLDREPDGLQDPDPFKIVYGSIASGEAVMQDPTIFKRLARTQGMRKVVGLEMEASAILQLARRRKLPYAIVMKGVMDYADMFKSDDMKAFAARASAECLIAFLRQHLPADLHRQPGMTPQRRQ